MSIVILFPAALFLSFFCRLDSTVAFKLANCWNEQLIPKSPVFIFRCQLGEEHMNLLTNRISWKVINLFVVHAMRTLE